MFAKMWKNQWNSHSLLVECKIVQTLQKKFWLFLIKLIMHLLYNLAIFLLGIDPREMKKYLCIQKDW